MALRTKVKEPEDWEQYFVEAGISSCLAKTQAVVFANEKLTIRTLQMLDRAMLRELGVTSMGKALCILKQAKEAAPQATYVKAPTAKLPQLSLLRKATQLKLTSFIEECMSSLWSSMWIGSLYKNGPIQHIFMSGVHPFTYSLQITQRCILDTTLLELTNILQFTFMAYQTLLLFDTRSSLNIYMIFKHFVDNIFERARPDVFFTRKSITI